MVPPYFEMLENTSLIYLFYGNITVRYFYRLLLCPKFINNLNFISTLNSLILTLCKVVIHYFDIVIAFIQLISNISFNIIFVKYYYIATGALIPNSFSPLAIISLVYSTSFKRKPLTFSPSIIL